MVSVPAAPALIPLPEDFQIDWPFPGAELLPWTQDRQHLPHPVSPMSAWWAENGFSVGTNRALERLGLPPRFHIARLNTYYYMAVFPDVSPDEAAAMEASAAANLMTAVQDFARRWDDEWLPELRQRWDEWARFDCARASFEELDARIDEAVELYRRVFDIHFSLLIPAFAGFSSFVDFHQATFPGGPELAPYRLLQGMDSLSVEAGRRLWTISRQLLNVPGLAEKVASTAACDLPAVLASGTESREILAQMDEYLADFGKRSDTVQELADPSWVEDPTPAYDNLKAYVIRHEDPDILYRTICDEREAAVHEARQLLADAPPETRGQFEALLAAAQACSRLQEDHNYWIDQRSLHEVRQLCLEFGRRFASMGLIDTPDDIFLLTMPEVREAAVQPRDLRPIVAERRAHMEHFGAIQAAPMVGTDYGPPPDNPLTRGLAMMFGGPPKPPAPAREVRGNAASTGKVEGIARVIMTIADAGRLSAGEIMVAPTTSPPWTPFFATASAIVTETGGTLSHCAVVAREYGLPAVVGAVGATKVIPDGATVLVDGDAGIVRILE